MLRGLAGCLLSFVWAAGCVEPPEAVTVPAPAQDAGIEPASYVVTIGHGVFIFEDGTQTREPTLDQIHATQRHWIAELETEEHASDPLKAAIFVDFADPILARAVYLQHLIHEVEPVAAANVSTVNGALRTYYLADILQQPPEAVREAAAQADEYLGAR